MEQTELTFPTLEFPGPTQAQKQQSLSHIFNNNQFYEMEEVMGRSIYVTHVFSEVVKNKRDEQTFTELLKL